MPKERIKKARPIGRTARREEKSIGARMGNAQSSHALLQRFSERPSDFWAVSCDLAEMRIRSQGLLSDPEKYPDVSNIEKWLERNISDSRRELQGMVLSNPRAFFKAGEPVETSFLDLPGHRGYTSFEDWFKTASAWWDTHAQTRIDKIRAMNHVGHLETTSRTSH